MISVKGTKLFLHSNKVSDIMGSLSFGFVGTAVSDILDGGMVQLKIDTFSPDTPLYIVKQNDGKVVICEYSHMPNYNHPEDLLCWPVAHPNTEAFDQFVAMLQSGSSNI